MRVLFSWCGMLRRRRLAHHFVNPGFRCVPEFQEVDLEPSEMHQLKGSQVTQGAKPFTPISPRIMNHIIVTTQNINPLTYLKT